jgi:hypothetical protein
MLKLKKTPFQIVKEKCAIYDPGIVNFQLGYPIIKNKVSPMLPTRSKELKLGVN